MTNYRKDFPFFSQKVAGVSPIYLDSSATSQKPQEVIDRLTDFYTFHNANIYRSIYKVAEETTECYENVRDKVKRFINAKDRSEIIFTKGTTQSLNWIAFGYFSHILKQDDEILLTVAEHHSNIIPWQQIAKKTGAKLQYVGLNSEQTLDLDDLSSKLNSNTKVLSIAHVSNVLGDIVPIEQIIERAHSIGAKVVVDGAQSIGHISVDVQKINCDFYAFSGHKMFGPTGIGILYGKKDLLEDLTPIEYGGEMIEKVDYDKTTFKSLPIRLEAGTQNIAGVIGLGQAIDYIEKIGLSNITEYNRKLTDYFFNELKKIPQIIIYGSPKAELHSDIISFNLKGIHPHDVATIFDALGVEVRAGFHCAQILMKNLEIVACVRVSLHLYNNKEDCDSLIKAIKEVRRIFIHE